MHYKEKLYNLRKELHETPELSFQEENTSLIIKNFILDTVGENDSFKIHSPFKTSIVVEYRGGKDEPFIIFRADMDALPVEESSSNKYLSKNCGMMHACGHDIHMTVLCGLIAETSDKLPSKNILFVFQPGEEGAGGAKQMMETGFFDKYSVKAAFALHVTDSLELGEAGSNGDVLFAIPKEIDIVFKGSSGHAAYPEKGNDAIAASASFLSNVEHRIRKVINPTETFLAHFGKITGGKARNIIADEVKVEGTLRALDRKIMDKGTEEIVKAAEIAASCFGCRSEAKVLGEYLEVRNSPDLFGVLEKVCSEHGVRCVEKKAELVGEDFCYFTDRYQGLLFWIGTKLPGKNPEQLHSSRFFPDDQVIPVGIKIMWSFINLI